MDMDIGGITGIIRNLLLLAVLAPAAIQAQTSIRFADVTRDTGIGFKHTDGGTGKRFIMETVSAGLALFDYDRDGDIDIYFLNGAPFETDAHSPAPTNQLYRNEGNWRFVDVTNESGLGDPGYGLGVAVGDIDNDGYPDLYLNNYGPNLLYRNKGNGTFTDITRRAGLGIKAQVGAGACFLDIEGDGDLDLYVSTYLDFSGDKHMSGMMNGYPTYANPKIFPPLPDSLYRNNGDGTFTEVSEEAGISAHAGWGMGIVSADYDKDGDTDIFVGNDVAENFLFKNDGSGSFSEEALMSGVAYNLNGEPHASMGVDCGDYNNDGWLDFLVTSYQQELVTLYHNLGNGILEDVTMRTGAGSGTLPKVTWGTSLVDFDHDGDRDIFIACGHLQDNIDRFDRITSYPQRNLVLMNTGNGHFQDVSSQCGSGLAVKRSSRGAGFDDLDNDGDVDVVLVNSRREPTILRNNTPPKGHWLQITLQGTRTNRDAIGAQVTVKAGNLELLDEVHSGRGYQSHYGSRLYFGLDSQTKVDSIEVRWIGGDTEVFKDIEVDQHVTLIEGSGR